MKKNSIKQAIIVEGRDDVDAVQKAVEALIIPTHGFGITEETWGIIDKAAKDKGLIILTDPDFSGEEIRKKISQRYPKALHAYVSQKDAQKNGDIGIENATLEKILEAINKAIDNSENHTGKNENYVPVNNKDLLEFGLIGIEGSNELRNKLTEKLGIGHANGKALIKKLAQWEIGKKELEQKIKEIK